jgi:hypothetical protein
LEAGYRVILRIVYVATCNFCCMLEIMVAN